MAIDSVSSGASASASASAAARSQLRTQQSEQEQKTQKLENDRENDRIRSERAAAESARTAEENKSKPSVNTSGQVVGSRINTTA